MNEEKLDAQKQSPQEVPNSEPVEETAQADESTKQIVEDTPVTNELKKADPMKRIIALVIDIVVAVVPMIILFAIPVLGGIVAIASTCYILFRDGLPIEALGNRSVGKKVMNLKVISVDNPAAPIDLMTSLKRNWVFAISSVPSIFTVIPVLGHIIMAVLAIPFSLAGLVMVIIETVKIYTVPDGKRIGDNIAKTMVIEG